MLFLLSPPAFSLRHAIGPWAGPSVAVVVAAAVAMMVAIFVVDMMAQVRCNIAQSGPRPGLG